MRDRFPPGDPPTSHRWLEEEAVVTQPPAAAPVSASMAPKPDLAASGRDPSLARLLMSFLTGRRRTPDGGFGHEDLLWFPCEGSVSESDKVPLLGSAPVTSRPDLRRESPLRSASAAAFTSLFRRADLRSGSAPSWGRELGFPSHALPVRALALGPAQRERATRPEVPGVRGDASPRPGPAGRGSISATLPTRVRPRRRSPPRRPGSSLGSLGPPGVGEKDPRWSGAGSRAPARRSLRRPRAAVRAPSA